jgi:hypothetical protein
VAWETPRRKQQHVNALIIARPDKARSDAFRRRNDALQPPRIYRQIKIGSAASPFNLDESNGSAAPGDKVNLSARRLHAPGENSPARQPKIPCRQRFAASAKAFPFGAVHFNSIARA